MRKITKIVGLGSVAAVAATVAWHALAQPPFSGPYGMGPGMMTGMGAHGPMGGRFADPATHLAALKTKLGVTAQQEQAWDAYAKAVEGAASSMKAARQAFAGKSPHDFSDADRQAFITRMRQQHEKNFAAVKTAAEKLLPTLDDAQKTKAKEILPGLAAPGPGMMWHAAMMPPFMQNQTTR
jgi:hypothetical protein